MTRFEGPDVASANQLEKNGGWHYLMLPVPGVFLSPELVDKARQAAQEYEDRKAKENKRPPKPPQRPGGLLVGRLVVEHSL